VPLIINQLIMFTPQSKMLYSRAMWKFTLHAVNATLADLLNNAGRIRWLFHSKTCNSNGADV